MLFVGVVKAHGSVQFHDNWFVLETACCLAIVRNIEPSTD